jgi:hypothetical protein
VGIGDVAVFVGVRVAGLIAELRRAGIGDHIGYRYAADRLQLGVEDR